jgi:hypothetical protein
VFVTLISLMATAATQGSGLQPELRAFLSGEMKFSPSDLADLQAGKIVAHGLGASAPGEIAAVGAVRVHVGRDAFVNQYRDIVRFKRGPEVLQIGRFSHPPTLDDLAALTLSKEDVDMRTCRVGHCDIRLPAATIARFQREIDWMARDADARAAALFKQVLLDHVGAYLTGGPGQIFAYDDEKRAVHPVDDFAGLLQNSPYIGRLVPGLPDHLRDVREPLAGAEDFLYWSKEKFGFTPFVTVTQVTILPATPTSTVIASKDAYSSRYFDASLTLTIASDGVGVAGNDFYLVYMNKSRASALKGSFSSLRRAIVERRVKSSLDENLRLVKSRLEDKP